MKHVKNQTKSLDFIDNFFFRNNFKYIYFKTKTKSDTFKNG